MLVLWCFTGGVLCYGFLFFHFFLAFSSFFFLFCFSILLGGREGRKRVRARGRAGECSQRMRLGEGCVKREFDESLVLARVNGHRRRLERHDQEDELRVGKCIKTRSAR